MRIQKPNEYSQQDMAENAVFFLTFLNKEGNLVKKNKLFFLFFGN